LFVKNGQTNFTHLCQEGDILTIPIAHGEGNYYCSDEELESLKNDNQIVFQYCSAGGDIIPESNPNGSINNIAGIINKSGNVLGMMPHPERNAENIIGNSDGKKILSSLVERYTRN
jgi:phosphoribosylformylglycinamidine synthase